MDVFVLSHESHDSDNPAKVYKPNDIVGVYETLEAAQKHADVKEWKHIEPDESNFILEQWYAITEFEAIKLRHRWLIRRFHVQG
jgi:hypothetical protein